MLEDKKHLGQFFTTNAFKILEGFETFIKNKEVVDPFCGAGDLLFWAKQNGAKSVEGYDIDKKYVDNKTTYYNNSIKNAKYYKFVITNPPYLYINNCDDEQRQYFENTKHTDLYQVSMASIMDCEEGILIVPINFLSAENSKYIRRQFLDKFEIVLVNYFEDSVFADTTYTVMAMYFKQKSIPTNSISFVLKCYPKGFCQKLSIFKDYDYTVGGEFYYKILKTPNNLKISRVEDKHIIYGENQMLCAKYALPNVEKYFVNNATKHTLENNIILLKAIDNGSFGGGICLQDIREHNIGGLISKVSARAYVQLLFGVQIPIDQQLQLIDIFNTQLKQEREKYASLFLTNYKDHGRKRISFDFCYKYICYLYKEFCVK
jgi:hypothetical protein